MPKPQERNQEETKVIFQSWLEEKLQLPQILMSKFWGAQKILAFPMKL